MLPLNMKKIIYTLTGLLSMQTVSAHCPLCTAAAGAAVLGAKYYGADMSVIGIFLGAFAISIGLWINRKAKQYIPFQKTIVLLASFLLTVIPIVYAIPSDHIYAPILWLGSAGGILNKVYWVNKLLFGSIIGTFLTLGAWWIHLKIKETHGRVFFPFQGIVITLAILFLCGAILQWVF
ncbi:hypothetical protein HY486_04000 [Candidatus Woesearchaeota archaeon]|nr:hypothetical protein [Candidatus Woesearchaeota archaeon]